MVDGEFQNAGCKRFRSFELWKQSIGQFGSLLLEQVDDMIYATSPGSEDRIVGNYSVRLGFGYKWPAIKWSRRYRKFKNVSKMEFA